MVKTDTKTVLLDATEWVARSHKHDGFSYTDLSKCVGTRTARALFSCILSEFTFRMIFRCLPIVIRP